VSALAYFLSFNSQRLQFLLASNLAFLSSSIQVCDYFFKGALAPAVVVVCGKPNLANSLVDLLAGSVPQESPNVVVPYCSALRDIDPEVRLH